MFGCRSSSSSFLSRADHLLQIVNSCIKSKLPNHLQGNYCSYYYSMSFNNKMKGPKPKVQLSDWNEKQKSVVGHQWRPISTIQPKSAQAECLAKDVSVAESGDGDQTQEMHCSASISIEDSEKTEVSVIDAMHSTNSSTDSLLKPVISEAKHSVTIEVGPSLIRFMKGTGGFTQQKIEEEMGVKIILPIPSSKMEESVVIEGQSRKSVTRAMEKIQAIIDEAVNSPSFDYSHFISLPLAIYPELVDKLVNFQNSVLGVADQIRKSDSNKDTSDNDNKDQKSSEGNDVGVKLKVEDDRHVKVDLTSIPVVSYSPKVSSSSKASGSPALSDLDIDRSIFIKPKTFHLTVLMLKLWNKERVKAASEVLKSVSGKVMDALDNRPLSIRLKGLDCMRGSLSKARVLYATVEEIGNEERLLWACQVITDAFVEAGLAIEKDAKQKLKLHATVMNARHRKGKFRNKKHDSFDARGIFKQFGSEEWGEYLIREAHLSQRFVFDESGYYHCCASIPFPESSLAD